MEELYHDIGLALYKVARDHGIAMSSKEFRDALRAADMHTSCNVMLDMPKSKELSNSLLDLHKSIMQLVISFINDHPDLLAKMREKQVELEEEMNQGISDEKMKLWPDIRACFYADNFDESIDNNRWVSSTDSSLVLSIGTKTVVESM